MELEEVQRERRRTAHELRMHSAYTAIGEMLVERAMMQKTIVEMIEAEHGVSPQFFEEVH